ncbi:MAG: hypothetical protein LBV07_05800, partial [Syntrophobacterales bacterium]|nr:hypothetical protein [Syntrophobacterales bacterium]
MFDLKKLFGSKDGKQSWEQLQKIVWAAVSGAKTMKDALNGGLKKLFEAALPKKTAAELSAIVMRLEEYTYEPSTYRRSCRSRDPKDYYDKLLNLANEVNFNWKEFDLLTSLQMSDDQKQEKHYKSPGYWTISMLIALKIDQHDKDVIDAVTDIILSENNTRAVSHELIRGVAMSRNAELHGLMKNLLLAAKLQEGLRQAILETADDGVLDYFKVIIKAVLENDLLRFSATLRAVCVWMGLGYDYSDRRAVEKLLKLGYAYMENDAERKDAIGSADVTQMYAAMWAESVFSIQNLHTHIERYMRGEKYQKMAGAYFLNETGSSENGVRLAGDCLGETDMDILTLILQSYNLKLHSITEGYWNEDKEKQIDHGKYPECLKNKSTREKHFSRLAEIMEKIPKDGHNIMGKPFDWCGFTLTRGSVYEMMMVLGVYDFNAAKQKRLIELFPFADSNNRGDFLSFFISREISGGKLSSTSRDFLFGCLGDKSMPVRVRAVKLLKGISLDDSEIVKVEELLALKTGEIRQTVLEVIRNAGDAAVMSSISRLIAAKNDNKRLAALDLLSGAKKNGAIADAAIHEFLASMPKTTEAEAIIIKSMTDASSPEYSAENGFGLYDPAYFPALPPIERDGKYDLRAFRSTGAKEMIKVFASLTALIEEHKDYEYKAIHTYVGTEDCILGNTRWLHTVTDNQEGRQVRMEDYALGEVWSGWFAKNRAHLLAMIKISYAEYVSSYDGSYDLDYKPFARNLIKKNLGYDEIKSFLKKEHGGKYYFLACNIIQTLLSHAAESSEMFSACCGILADFFLSTPKEDWAKPCEKGEFYYNADNKLADGSELGFFLH